MQSLVANGCIASSFYIKPQHRQQGAHGKDVVLHPLSTSNHNRFRQYVPLWGVVLHPLSTSNHNGARLKHESERVVLHPLSTSNHNCHPRRWCNLRVVLHPLSTSNHNCFIEIGFFVKLYCILFLHQTTTTFGIFSPAAGLYCILFLHQTTTILDLHQCRRLLYCILFLHQTTTLSSSSAAEWRCIASSFYIKPQLIFRQRRLVSSCIASSFYIKPQPRTPDTLIFGHLTASRHDTKRGGVHRGSRFDAVFTFSTNIRKIIFTEIRRCMSVQRAGARLRSDSSEANI